ncbi:MAG: glutaredoxin 3 [Salinarimonadaceae bacterium]|nr:MAG: glutaredoxin 3 [Salinarimonadaceae bacterium]TVR10685.1 MAG: glutaredoxin 3 [Salinarimonadaceae bacterium]
MSPSRSPVIIYTRSWCGYCAAAKSLLSGKGVAFEEIDIEAVSGARAQMIKRAGGRTSVPQIFVGDTHLGGFDDVSALERRGGLDKLLAGERTP